MTRRDAVMKALAFQPAGYVPWSFRLTGDAARRLGRALGEADLDEVLAPHIFDVRCKIRGFDAVDDTHVRDKYGVVWDRRVDHDIGTPVDWPIKCPADLARYRWPNADDDTLWEGLDGQLAAHRDRFCRYSLAMCLYERAWSLRGMAELLTDMIERPEFVEEFLDLIVEHNLVLVRRALALGVDAVHFGDDYGMQTGLIMGPGLWRRFIKPRLARLFAPVKAAGKVVSMHSCGKVQEVFDDLVEIGLNLFNPFQPEVMDVLEVLPAWRGRLAFHGGMSIQRTLPFGSAGEVREQTRRLLELGRAGGYIFAPAHDVPGDVPPENLLAMLEVLKSQSGM
jgi:uroporphyrinogen decarboxylase